MSEVVKLKVNAEQLKKIVANAPPVIQKPKARSRSRTTKPAPSRSQSPSGIKKPRPLSGAAALSVAAAQSSSNGPSRSATPGVQAARSGYQGNNMRIGGLTMNTNTTITLDKSGRPCGRWLKDNRVKRTVHSFSGYEIPLKSWHRVGGQRGLKKEKEERQQERKAKAQAKAEADVKAAEAKAADEAKKATGSGVGGAVTVI